MFTNSIQLTTKQVGHLKIGVRCALAFGIAVSIGANAVHAITASIAAHDPRPILFGSIALAALAPVFAFVCLEFIVRIPVRSTGANIARLLATGGLAGLAFWISFWNIAQVAAMFHETSTRYLWPLVIDGMMLVATISMVALASYGQHVEETIHATVQADADTAAIAAAAQAMAAKAKAKALADAQKASAKYQKMTSAGDRAKWSREWGTKYDAEQRRAAATAPVSPAPASGTPVVPVSVAQVAAAVS